MTTKGTSKRKKRTKTNSDLNGVLVKSEELTRNKPPASSTQKCDVCDGPYATKDYWYTSKNPPSQWSGKPKI